MAGSARPRRIPCPAAGPPPRPPERAAARDSKHDAQREGEQGADTIELNLRRRRAPPGSPPRWFPRRAPADWPPSRHPRASPHVACARPQTRQLLELTGLDRTLRPARTLTDALQALPAARNSPSGTAARPGPARRR
jgi:hypothetical protein